MKAAFVTEAYKVEVKEIERPEIKADEVLIKVKAVGVCGSDLHLFHGSHPFRKPPAILGHEIAGEIVEIGSEVTKFKVGDRVTVEPQVGCGECELCKAGWINLCKQKKVPGTPAWIGTFSEYFNAPECTVYKMNDDISYEVASLAEPFAVAVHAINRFSAKEEEKGTLVILGCGTIGLMLVVAAREAGWKNIICTDTVEYNRNMAIHFGAKAVFNPLEEDCIQKIRAMTNDRGADAVLIAAGAPNIVDQACSVVRKRGEVGFVAMITQNIPVYTYATVFNELTIVGSMTYQTEDFKQAVDMINGGLAMEDFITQKIPLEESQKALDVLSEKKENVIKVIVTME